MPEQRRSHHALAAVTGGTGFLGLHLVPALAQAGFRLRLLTRRDPAHPAFAGIPFEALPGDLDDTAAQAALVRDADVVVHAAGLIKAHNRAEFLHANRDGTAALAQTTRRVAPQARFILVSSLAAREPQLSNYAASKNEAEAAARHAFHAAPGQLAIIRPPAIYGPWDQGTLPWFQASLGPVAPVLGNGKTALIHARDAAGAITAMAGAAFRPGAFTLADERPEGYTLRTLMEAAVRATGGHPRLIALPRAVLLAAGAYADLVGKIRNRPSVFSLGKAREILHADWSVPAEELLPREIHTPRIGLQEGFAETVAWYRQAGWLK